MKEIFSAGEEVPAYHEKLLIVKMQPAVQTRIASFGISGERETWDTPGLDALAMFERGGMIKRVTPVSRKAATRVVSGPRRALASFAASFTVDRKDPSDLSAGVNVIEMEQEGHVAELQSALATDPNVEFVSRVPIRYLVVAKRARPTRRKVALAAPNPSQLWNLQKIKWQQSRGIKGFKEADSIKVAVLDTGIDKDHPDLKGQIGSYVFAHPDQRRASGEKDIVGHGTHVAGTIAAKINNDIGINGICDCDLKIWKIFDDVADFVSFSYGYAYFVEPIMYFRALADCLEQQVDVINLSIGGGGAPDHFESTLFDQLIKQGVTVVAAMGNEREDGSPISYPAAIPGVIAVGATKIDDKVASFSNRGNHISLCAPGVAIWSTLPTTPGQFGFRAERGTDGRPREGKPERRETDYDAWDGTSMATPHVAAAAALLLSNRGKMAPADVRARLMATAVRVKRMGGKSFHPDYGAGRLDLLKLLST
jgi:subtilisin family serine protease